MKENLSRRWFLGNAGFAAAGFSAIANPIAAAAQSVGVKPGDLPDLTIKEVKVYVTDISKIHKLNSPETGELLSIVTNSGIEGNYTIGDRNATAGWLEWAKMALVGMNIMDLLPTLTSTSGMKGPGGFDGAGFHLVDSFAGFPQPRAEDFIPIRSGGDTRSAPAFSAGDAAVSFEQVQAVFRDFPGVQFHRGFIPQVLAQLPETCWAFVHVDVDLHEPTLASLEYFYPRMVKGGVILCDDYGSRLFPGARKAWESYCEAKGIAFVTLDTGQSVIIR